MKSNRLVYNRKNNVNGYAIGQVGTGMSFAEKFKALESHDPLLRSHNWRKMHGLPIKTPRLIKIDTQKGSFKRSKRKQARYHEKHVFNPMDMDIKQHSSV